MSNYTAARKRRADHGLDWRFEWQRYVSRRLGGKATVLAVAGALAARARNEDGTVFLSSETMAAEIGKAENHTKDARKILVDDGFLIDTGRTLRGCKVWLLAFPPVRLSDTKAVAAEKRLHHRRIDLAGDPDLGSPDRTDPDLGSPPVLAEGPESRNTGTRISEHRDPNLGSHTGDGTRHGTGDGSTDGARERDASAPAGRPGYGAAPLTDPGCDDGATATTGGASAAGPGASAATQDNDTMEAEPMTCWYCGAMGDAPVCVDCDPADSQDAVAAGTGLPAEHGGTPGGHDPSAPARARAVDAVMALLRKRDPVMVDEPAVIAAIRKADEHVLYGEVIDDLGRTGLVERVTDQDRGYHYGLMPPPAVAAEADEDDVFDTDMIA